MLVTVVGMAVSVLWFLIIKSHSDLNKIKFDVIHELESHLPAAIFKYQWELAEQGRGKTYLAVTAIEKWIPILFVALHLVLGLLVLLSLSEVVTW